MDFWESKLDVKSQEIEDRQKNSSVPQGYGLCSKCGHFSFRKTKLMDEEVLCEAYMENNRYMKIQPRLYDPIIDCSYFYARGQMSIEAMSRIAWIIDVKKRQIGFTGQETIDVVVTEPKEDSEKNK